MRHERLIEKDRRVARERALVILQVRSGALTAKEGAKLLGVSRKTYYEWEAKSLKAMALALENHPAGRPVYLWTKRRRPFGSGSGSWRRNWIWPRRPSRSRNCWLDFDTGAKKKRIDRQEAIKRIVEIIEEHEGTDRDALWGDLQDASSSLGEL